MEPQIYTDTASVEQIVDWATDEFNKLNHPKEVKLIIADEAIIKERNRLFLYRFKKRMFYKMNSLPKIFRRWRWLTNLLYKTAEIQCLQFKETVVAESLNLETDFEDAIIVYPTRFDMVINLVQNRIKSYETIVREVIRHEIRHSCQTEEMRLVGLNPSVAFSFDAMLYKYGEGPLEKDAIASQIGENKTPIKEVISSLKDQMKKKGWKLS